MATHADAPAGPAVPLARVRAFSLARQNLVGDGAADVRAAALATGGVYASAPTCYLSFAARVRDFRVADLDAELYVRRRVVRLRCMHEMVYVVPGEAVPVVAAATRAGEKAEARLLRLGELTPEEFAALADRIDGVLVDAPPATLAELRKLVGADVPGNSSAFQYSVALMGRQNRLVRASVRGSWRSDSYAYARWADWMGAPVEAVEPETARTELARRYLRSYGPATAADLKWWAGWTARETTAALAALGDDAAPVTLTDEDDAGEPPSAAYVLAEDLDALTGADVDAACGVRLLPVWDTYAMGYSERRRVAGETDYGRVYDRVGNATSVVLVDGVAAAVWEFDHAGEVPGGSLAVRVAPFGSAVAGRWPEIEEAAARIARAVGADELRVERAHDPGLLDDAVRNAFMAPIRLGTPA